MTTLIDPLDRSPATAKAWRGSDDLAATGHTGVRAGLLDHDVGTRMGSNARTQSLCRCLLVGMSRVDHGLVAAGH